MSYGHIFWMFLFASVSCMVLNLGHGIDQRSKVQHPAASISHEVGVWRARGMNTLVAHQHLQGELVSLVIIHQAIGGDELDQHEEADTRRQDRELTAAWMAASSMGANTPYYSRVRRPVYAGATLRDANRKLKELLAEVYWAKYGAKLMQQSSIPWVVAAGVAIEAFADLLEQEIGQEWIALQNLYQLAVQLSPLKRAFIQTYLPRAKSQLDRIVRAIPEVARTHADALAERYGVRVHIDDQDLRLPVVVDPYATLSAPPPQWRRPLDCDCPSPPADNLRFQMVKTSQLALATFPWVNYHRRPVQQRLYFRAFLSGAGDRFFHYSNGESRNILDRLQRARGMGMYVFPEKIAPDKGWEDWTEEQHSDKADKLFASLILTGHKLETPIGSPFLFREPIHDYRIRWDAVMLHNLNQQQRPEHRIDLYCKRIVPSNQAIVGYDTLGWDQSRGRVSELVGISIPYTFPSIQTAWSYTTTPVTNYQIERLHESSLPSWSQSVLEVLPQSLPKHDP